MNPHFQTHLVNGTFGDPAVYVEFKFQGRALLFDLGDLTPLSPRRILRLGHVFVSHTHMDHFVGFDHMLRLFLGREKRLHLFGPAGFIGQVEAKLGAYTWNLAPTFTTNLAIAVTEVADARSGSRAEFHLRERFRRRDLGHVAFEDRILLDEPALRVRFAILDHDVPCLAFALEESRHVNVWRNRVEEMGFGVGPWLRELKEAVHRGDADETPFRIRWWDGTGTREDTRPLGELKRYLLTVTPGQRIVYVTDAAPHAANFEAIVELARGADLLFAEAVFLEADLDIAIRKKHLTAHQAGALARRAGARRVVPFHFSTRYSDRGDELIREVKAAFDERDPSQTQGIEKRQ